MATAASHGLGQRAVAAARRRFWHLSLSTRLVTLVVLAVLITATAVSLTLASIARQDLIDAEAARLESSLPREAALVSARVQTLRGDASLLAHLPEVNNLVAADAQERGAALAALQKVFADLLSVRPGYSEVRLIAATEAGLELTRVLSDGTTPTAIPPTDASERAESYVLEASGLAPGEVFVSDIVLDDEPGIDEEPQPVIRATTQAFDASGELIGTIVVEASLRRWLTVIENGEGDPRGVFLSNGDFEYSYRMVNGELLTFPLEELERIRRDYPALVPILDGIRNENSAVTAEQVIQGQRVATNPQDPDRFLLLAAVTPIASIVAGVDSMWDWVLGLALPLTLLCSLGAVALGSWAGRRLRRMRATAEEFATGRLDARVEHADAEGDELSSLAHSLNMMADRLSATLVKRDRLAEEVSERSRAQLELQASTDLLSRKHAELNTQARELEVTNRELEAFSYSVSHDLRGPLRSIDGFSLALVEDYSDELGEGGRDMVRRVREATMKMGRLIDDLLGLSRVARATFEPMEVDLSAMARDQITTLRDRDRQREVDVRIAPGVRAECDPRLTAILLSNLLENAWKYTSKTDKPVIEFGPVSNAEGQGFYVRDNGVGFDMAYADKLFRPFQRLHATADFAGTGIGLATVSRVVLRHGGSISAKAEVGRGATFTVILSPAEAGEIALEKEVA